MVTKILITKKIIAGVNVVGGLISPVHDEYSRQKGTLISSKHRVKMIRLTLSEQVSTLDRANLAQSPHKLLNGIDPTGS